MQLPPCRSRAQYVVGSPFGHRARRRGVCEEAGGEDNDGGEEEGGVGGGEEEGGLAVTVAAAAAAAGAAVTGFVAGRCTDIALMPAAARAAREGWFAVSRSPTHAPLVALYCHVTPWVASNGTPPLTTVAPGVGSEARKMTSLPGPDPEWRASRARVPF